MQENCTVLRITPMTRSADEVELRIAGQLTGDSVALLLQEMARWLQSTQRLVLDLEGVQNIDQAGLDLLHSRAGTRVRWHGGSPFVRALLRTRGL